MIASMLVQALYNVVDSCFVGKFSDDALIALSVVFPMQFLIIAVGYVVSRCGILSQEGSRTLSRLVIYVTFPAYILGRAMAAEQASPRLVLLMLGLSFAHYLVLFGLAWLWPRVFRVPAAQIGSYRFMLTFANVGLSAFPWWRRCWATRPFSPPPCSTCPSTCWSTPWA